MAVRTPSPCPAVAPPALTAMGLGLLSSMATGLALLVILCSQIAAQRPASQGVMELHVGRGGELRLWHQPIRPQDLPPLLERARRSSASGASLVVRVVPQPDVPWGVVNGLLARLRPPDGSNSWILQLQLP